jgi:hypothetical protein
MVDFLYNCFQKFEVVF